MAEIRGIEAREILDSRGNPTVEVELTTGFGKFLASVPSGASKGKYEAVELRDEDGRGVSKAIKNIEKIIFPAIEKEDLTNQKRVDEILIKLDGTKNKSRLGANAVLGTSLAVCRAGAKSKKMPLWKWISKLSDVEPLLPDPSILLIEGGLHGKGGLDIQEFMGVFPGKSFKEKLKAGISVYNQLGENLRKKYGKRGVVLGMEGAFSPPIKDPKEVLDLVIKASGRKKVKIILDMAVSHSRFPKTLEYYLDLIKHYPVVGLEDPFSQEDWRRWSLLSSRLKAQNSKVLIIGDDLTITNSERIKEARKRRACNAVIIKPNQIGTVSETIGAAKLAKSFGWKVMVSHRSSETMDDFIADLAVGIGADFIKSGAPSKPERMAKYNRLLRIEEELHA